MQGALAAILPGNLSTNSAGDERLHLQHGPIDLIIGVDGGAPARRAAFDTARARFDTVLNELVAELPMLRSGVDDTPGAARPNGAIARRMYDAAARSGAEFVTPMAAVAGAVADEILAAICAIKNGAPTQPNIERIYVNNGGDIAIHLPKDARFRMAIAGLNNADLGRIEVAHGSGIGGIATSGMGGRSLSMGIADSVTVLAGNAAQADVAATLIANAVDLPGHPAIMRCAAHEINPDSDLGTRSVVTKCGLLNAREIDVALMAGAQLANDMKAKGLIIGAALFLQGASRLVTFPVADIVTKVREHA